MRDMNKSRLITVGSAAAVLALTAGAASAASSMITSKDIQDGAVHRADLEQGRHTRPRQGPGPNGPIYRVAHYHQRRGGTAVATVACANNDREVAEVHRHRRRRPDHRRRGDRTSATTRPRGLRLLPRPHGLDHRHARSRTGSTAGSCWDNAAKSTDNLNVWALCITIDDIQVQTVNLNN